MITKNKKMIPKILLCIAFSLISKVVFSQEINLFIQNIKEERSMSSEDSFIELTTIINGLRTDEFNQVKIKEITKAIDDQGNSLKRLESFFRDDYDQSNEIKIRLEAPARKSIRIKLIEGYIKYFSPSEDNNSKLIIKDLLDKYNENLLSSYYSDIKLTLIDKEALRKAKEGDEKEYKKQIDKLIKEGGLSEALVGTVDVFKQFFEGFSSFGSDEILSFYMEDKEDKIIEINIYNKKGENIKYGSSRSGDHNLTISLREKATSGCKIEILIENEKAVKELKFSLTNIILP